jgi:hypothetical protein
MIPGEMTDCDWADYWCDMANHYKRICDRWNTSFWTVAAVAAASLITNFILAFDH